MPDIGHLLLRQFADERSPTSIELLGKSSYLGEVIHMRVPGEAITQGNFDERHATFDQSSRKQASLAKAASPISGANLVGLEP